MVELNSNNEKNNIIRGNAKGDVFFSQKIYDDYLGSQGLLIDLKHLS